MAKVVVYSTQICPYCVRAKELLTRKGVAFEDIKVDNSVKLKHEMVERSGGRMTVPQIFIGDIHVGGCDDLYALEAKGELDPLLGITQKEEEVANHRKVIIVGSGPAGYTAAIYASRSALKPLLFTGPQKGGQLTTTTEVENFPGFPDGIDGNAMMDNFEKQAARLGTEIVFDMVTKVDLEQRPFKLEVGKKKYTCDSLIIATGAQAKWLGMESEERFKNKGVSACATCDGFFFRNQKVAVVGGGDTALEEANYLTNFCEKVYLLHRRDELRGSKAMQDLVMNNPKVEIKWSTIIDEVIGDDQKGMTDLMVKDAKTEEVYSLGVTGLFVAIGHKPNTDLFKDFLDTDEMGYLKTDGFSSKTNVPGVFACGDVMDSVYRQAVTSAGTGCMAAIDAERWLAEQD